MGPITPCCILDASESLQVTLLFPKLWIRCIWELRVCPDNDIRNREVDLETGDHLLVDQDK